MSPQSKPHRVCALAYDGLCTFEFGIAVEAFALPRPEFDFTWYYFQIISPDPSPLNATGGFTMDVPNGLAPLATANTLIIPGWKGADVPVPTALIAAIRQAHANGCRLVSICSGVFVLAATGLLAGKSATTHWRYTDDLAAAHPDINVKPDVLYQDAGNNIFTSAGSAAGLDLCLHLIRLDHGASVANTVARRFVLPTHRDGGQAQFIPSPPIAKHRNLAPLFDTLRARLHDPISVQDIATLAHMSPRSLIRHFKRATGMTPQSWLTSERIKRAKDLLETSVANIDSIALSCGFNTPETFRHHFRKHTGTSPSQYRKSFCTVLAAE